MFFPSPVSKISHANQKEKIYLDYDNDAYVSFSNNFKYLGSFIDERITDSLDVKIRINMASKAFFSLSKQVFRNKLLNMKTRAMIYKVLVLNALLWGCESWELTQEHRRQLEVFYHRCLWRILNVTICDVM